jgi:hypothetical protein
VLLIDFYKYGTYDIKIPLHSPLIKEKIENIPPKSSFDLEHRYFPEKPSPA